MKITKIDLLFCEPVEDAWQPAFCRVYTDAGIYGDGEIALSYAPVTNAALLKDIKDFAAMNGVYGEYFKGICPARAAFQVAALPMDALVEVEVVAVKK